MKFTQLIEKFHNAFYINKEYVEIFEDPSKKEIEDIIKNSKNHTVRFGITDTSNPKVYAWDGEILHRFVHPKRKFDFGFVWEKGELQGDVSESTWKSWDDLKHPIPVIKRIKKLFPRLHEIYLVTYGVASLDDAEGNV